MVLNSTEIFLFLFWMLGLKECTTTLRKNHIFFLKKEVLHCNLGGLEFETVLTPAWHRVPILSHCNTCQIFTMLVTLLIAMAKYLTKSILKMKDLQPVLQRELQDSQILWFF